MPENRFQAARQQSIEKIIIFTARGEGVQMALENFCSLEEYRKIQLVAVTFRRERNYLRGQAVRSEIPEEPRSCL